jgi:hypothetical protein
MTDAARPIIIYAFEPNGPNGVGGHEWQFIEEEGTLSEFLGWVSEQLRKQALDKPEDGGLYNRHYVMYGLADSHLKNEEIGRILDADSPWLSVNYQETIYTVSSRKSKGVEGDGV